MLERSGEKKNCEGSRQLGTPGPNIPETIDAILGQLKSGTIALSSPESMILEGTPRIELLLGVSTPIEQLKRMLREQGYVKTAEIKIAARMEAHLAGGDFQIVSITPETQGVSSVQATQWLWNITAIKPGRRQLHLSANAIFEVQGKEMTRAIRTFDKNIYVKVAWRQKMSGFVTTNRQWLWTALLIPLAGWLWARWQRRRASSRTQNDR